MRNHTATHILHAALRQIVGSHVRQAGSLVTPDRLRFDFTHLEGLTPEQVAEVELLSNKAVRENIPVNVQIPELRGRDRRRRAGVLRRQVRRRRARRWRLRCRMETSASARSSAAARTCMPPAMSATIVDHRRIVDRRRAATARGADRPRRRRADPRAGEHGQPPQRRFPDSAGRDRDAALPPCATRTTSSAGSSRPWSAASPAPRPNRCSPVAVALPTMPMTTSRIGETAVIVRRVDVTSGDGLRSRGRCAQAAIRQRGHPPRHRCSTAPRFLAMSTPDVSGKVPAGGIVSVGRKRGGRWRWRAARYRPGRRQGCFEARCRR